eukprot:jgi/Chlat1/8407/Chrsp80S07835
MASEQTPLLAAAVPAVVYRTYGSHGDVHRIEVAECDSNHDKDEDEEEEVNEEEAAVVVKDQQEPVEQRHDEATSRSLFCAAPLLWRHASCRFVALLLAVAVLIISYVGTIAGSFYKALVDQDKQLFLWTLASCALWYPLVAVTAAAQVYVKGNLALHWRIALTQLAHELIMHDRMFFTLAHDDVLDNPDQRIADDINKLCLTSADVLAIAAPLPLMIVYYTILVHRIVGLGGTAAVYCFFALSCVVNRLLVAPVAALVFQQEQCEGDFRTKHMRLRAHADEIALAKGSHTEQCALQQGFSLLAQCQKRVVTSHAALALAMKFFDYSGAALNYIVMAVPVFGGAFAADVGKGELARLISISSFAVLQLVYSFTRFNDLSAKVADAAAYGARVTQLFANITPGLKQQMTPQQRTTHQTVTSSPGATLMPPTQLLCFFDNAEPRVVEFSIHRPPPLLLDGITALCTGVDVSNILAVPTFQPAALDLCSDAMEVKAEMNRLLSQFIVWQEPICKALAEKGFWASGVNPETGGLLGADHADVRAAHYSEVRAGQFMLGYAAKMCGRCPVLIHPKYGTAVYPATLLTDAPLNTLLDVICTSSVAHLSSKGCMPGMQRIQPQVMLANVSLSTPAGVLLIEMLSLRLCGGDRLLITGPSGCGKSSLIKAIAGLWQLQAGYISVFPSQDAFMALSQRPLMAPAGGLAAQLTYPSMPNLNSCKVLRLQELLHLVDLDHLLLRCRGDWEAEMDWQSDLSEGEKQRIAIARVLCHRPPIVMLDEATSALPPDCEDRMYTLITSCCQLVISASHHMTLAKFHTAQLLLGVQPGGGWRLQHLNTLAGQ